MFDQYINCLNLFLFKPEGDFAQASEMKQVYNDLHPQRPVIHRLRDHSREVQPEGKLESK